LRPTSSADLRHFDVRRAEFHETKRWIGGREASYADSRGGSASGSTSHTLRAAEIAQQIAIAGGIHLTRPHYRRAVDIGSIVDPFVADVMVER
jgi:hypothetical protein